MTPGYRVEVSQKIKEEFENGSEYYKYHGGFIHMPNKDPLQPDNSNLSWHNEKIFLDKTFS